MPSAQNWSDAIALAKSLVDEDQETYNEVSLRYILNDGDEPGYRLELVTTMATVLANFLIHFSEDVDMSVEDVCTMILMERWRRDILGGELDD